MFGGQWMWVLGELAEGGQVGGGAAIAEDDGAIAEPAVEAEAADGRALESGVESGLIP